MSDVKCVLYIFQTVFLQLEDSLVAQHKGCTSDCQPVGRGLLGAQLPFHRGT